MEFLRPSEEERRQRAGSGRYPLRCSALGAEKLLDIFNAFCNTVSFSPNIVEKNYSETYFTNYYEQEKYDALSSNKQHGINEMCSYKVATQKDSYTYFCSKDSDGNLFPCQISIACNRTVDKELLLEKDGSGND